MKILIVHASAGAGHFKAAEAIYKGITQSTGHEVVLVDALDHASFLFQRFYKQSYFFLISKIPSIWGFFFWLLDLPWLQPVIRMGRRLQNTLNMGKLQRLMIKGGFDYIVMTHFMPTEIAAALKRSGRISSKLVTVITDFDVHRIWLAEGIDTYTVASAWTKEKLKKIGIPQEKIFVSGIPTDRKFSGPFDLDALRKTFRLKENMFTVLVATGSFGIGPIQEIIETLAGFQILVVCGHNQDLYRTLSAGGRTDVHVFGLVDNMQELMAVSDAMVTKPGGLSISEALVSRLPMIFFSAIPGQETGNIRVLKTYGIGISGCSIAQIGEELNRMNNSREIFHAAREKIGVLARPSAVSDIISLLR